jgi:cation-transporting ATPase E
VSYGTKSDSFRYGKALPRLEPDHDQGLTSAQARERFENGYDNVNLEPPTKIVGQIVRDNVFTYFNLIFFILAALIIAVGSYRDLTFMGVIVANTGIGIIQELRSKKTLDKLTFLAEPKAVVVRDGKEQSIPADETVLDDIVIFSAGNQIYADAVVVAGECHCNEALITGEADEIAKKPGDELLSGSFVISGTCRARLDRVGQDSFVSRLTMEAKKTGKKQRSEMMHALTKLVQIIGFIIIPVGIAMFVQQTVNLGGTVKEGVVSTVAALIGMIPEGLYLLVSVALTVSIMRLAKKKTLVHEMGCIETLARVDVLCVDKTGTITENKMVVKGTVKLCPDRFNDDDIHMIMTDYVGNMGADNETMVALQEYFNGTVQKKAEKILPFSSANKYSGLSYAVDESYLLGAPEMILRESYEDYRGEIEKYSAQGCRVLLLALYDGDIEQKGLNDDVMPLALILLTNKIREEAPATFRFFAQQGVQIKVISGDNPLTVSQVAVEAGIENANKYIDARELNTERKIKRAVREYTVFGRVTPDQKRRLVRALKAEGHTVAMTGDGVNDVLALKDADCSIAMASGSDVACHVAQLVLMESNFSAMPSVVMEGRRVINNIERSASLFLVKNIFSFLLAIVTLVCTLPYPLTPTQLSLVSMMTIGIPSFVLALEPNTSLVRGKFLLNVITKAIPAGLTDFVIVLAAVLLSPLLKITNDEMKTMATILMGAVGFMMMFRISRPFNVIRKALLILMIIGFTLGGLLFSELFAMSALSFKCIALTAGLIVLAVPVMYIFAKGVKVVTDRLQVRRKQQKRYY